MDRVDEVYVELMAERARAWADRARDAGVSVTRRDYAAKRAHSLRVGLGGRLRRCERRGTPVRCACGRGVRTWGCRLALLCKTCARKRRRRMEGRLRSAIAGMVERSPGAMTVLATLTVRHDGGPAAQRAHLAAGWRRFALALGRAYGFSEYVGVWEVTPGRDGAGHVHLHVVFRWPWRDWRAIHAMWRRACPDSTRISLVASRRGANEEPEALGAYLAKYLGKGANGARWTPELVAEVHAATYQLRWVFASRRTLPPAAAPVCPACGERRRCRTLHWHGAATPAPSPIPDWIDGEPWLQQRLQL